MLVNKLEKTGRMDNKYKQVISLKEADIQLEEYKVQNSFVKDMVNIISSQKQFVKDAEKVF